MEDTTVVIPFFDQNYCEELAKLSTESHSKEINHSNAIGPEELDNCDRCMFATLNNDRDFSWTVEQKNDHQKTVHVRVRLRYCSSSTMH